MSSNVMEILKIIVLLGVGCFLYREWQKRQTVEHHPKRIKTKIKRDRKLLKEGKHPYIAKPGILPIDETIPKDDMPIIPIPKPIVRKRKKKEPKEGIIYGRNGIKEIRGYARTVDVEGLRRRGWRFDRVDPILGRLYFTTPSGKKGFINIKSGKRYYLLKGNRFVDSITFLKNYDKYKNEVLREKKKKYKVRKGPIARIQPIGKPTPVRKRYKRQHDRRSRRTTRRRSYRRSRR